MRAMTTAEVIEASVTRSFRAAGAEPDAMQLRAASEAAAPDFDRVVRAGGTPTIAVDGPPLRLSASQHPGIGSVTVTIYSVLPAVADCSLVLWVYALMAGLLGISLALYALAWVFNGVTFLVIATRRWRIERRR